MSQVVEVLTNVSVIGTQGALWDDQHADLAGKPAANHTLLVVAGAGVSGGVVALMGSLDGVNWVALSSGSVTTSAPGAVSVSVSGAAFLYVTAKITTGITGGTISAWVAST